MATEMFQRCRKLLVRREVLLDQFYTSLKVSFQETQQDSGQLNDHSVIQSTIDQLFKKERSWENAYEIEQLMVPLFTDEQLAIELSRRVLETKQFGEEVSRYYEESSKNNTDRDTRQALFSRLIKDLQRREQISRIRRWYTRNAWLRGTFAFVLSFLVFFTPNLIPPDADPTPSDSEVDSSVSYFKSLTSTGKGHDVFTAIAAGALGAAFSLLIGLKKRLEESTLEGLRILQTRSYFFSRVVTGIGAGLIFYYFLQSGLLQGKMFPEFALNENKKLEVKDEFSLALLTVWCFLSGFSEKLIPNILSKTEEQMSDKSEDDYK